MTEKEHYSDDTLDHERTYAADIDMKGNPSELAKAKTPDAERSGDSAERSADDALASAAGKAGQT